MSARRARSAFAGVAMALVLVLLMPSRTPALIRMITNGDRWAQNGTLGQLGDFGTATLSLGLTPVSLYTDVTSAGLSLAIAIGATDTIWGAMPTTSILGHRPEARSRNSKTG